MYLYGKKEELIMNYFKKILSKKSAENEEEMKIIEALKKHMEADYVKNHLRYKELVDVLWNENINHIEEVFEGDRYKVLQLLFGEDKAKMFKIIWNSSIKYIYTIGSERRSYKSTKASKLHLRQNIIKLQDYIYLTASDFSLDKYFQGDIKEYEYIDVISDIIAIEIDNNNEKVLKQLNEVIYNDNNTAIVTREIIKGALMSECEEAYKMIGELFLAAKLQEGLRQAIVESLDEGSRKGFIYILKLIIDNNLIRFSSVVRAFCTWTGLSLEVEKPKVIKKCFEAAYNCLIDEEYKKECIASEENLLIYIGLWAVAFDEIDDTDDILKDLLHGDIKYKKLLALEFLYETQDHILMHKAACEMLVENDLEVITLAVRNMFSNLNSYSFTYNVQRLNEYEDLGAKYCGKELFDKIKRIIDIMPKKEIKFNEVVFPWVNINLTVEELMEKLILSVGMTNDNAIIDTIIDYKDKMSIHTRELFVGIFLKKPKTGKQKSALIEACGDKSQLVRTKAFRNIKAIKLEADDYFHIENFLKYKYGDLRKSAIKVLLEQESNALLNTVKNLAISKEENKKLAAIEIVNIIEKDSKYEDIFAQSLEYVSAVDDTLKNSKLVGNCSSVNKKDIKNFKNGFGLYDPSKEYIPLKVKRDKKLTYEFSIIYEEAKNIIDKFRALIHENRDFEYEVTEWDETKTTVTLGGSTYLIPFSRYTYDPLNSLNVERGLDNYPIGDKVRSFAKENQLDKWKLMELDFYMTITERESYAHYNKWYEEFLENNFNYNMVKRLSTEIKNKNYYNHIATYIHVLTDELPEAEKFKFSKAVAEDIYEIILDDKHLEDLSKKREFYSYSKAMHITHWLRIMLENAEEEKYFKEAFSIAYNYYKSSNYRTETSLSLIYFARAFEIDIIDENEVLKEILERPLSPSNIGVITSQRHYYLDSMKEYKKIFKVGKNVANLIAEIEASRGDLDTEVTPLAAEIERCYGVNIFAAIIINSEKDTFVRGYNYLGRDCTKKAILSHLLKGCYPKPEENAESLKKALKGKKVTTKQLIEAAMYSPQWLDIVSEYIGCDGLKSACWYFHAHVNDVFSDEKAAIVARYTPISVDDLKDGAFDQQWFKEAYAEIGEKRFKEVYDSAKYIAGGSLHKRSQLSADATLGKLKVKEVKAKVQDTRNKDYLLTYGLIPIKNEKDVLDRYEYIQQFIKESKKFGAQRQVSEGRSGKMALLNLARNAGFSDVNRLTWNMETAKIEGVLSYLEPKTVEDVEVKLTIDELGHADVVCIKASKELKSIPAKLKKNEYILEINQLKKSLKDQYVRARKSFEDAMENGENFKGEELIKLCQNPVLRPIIKNLLFKAGDFIGYLADDALVDYKKDVYKLKEDDEVIIVHPIHLYEAKVWQEYQKDIYSKKIVQPFKQVFRELYIPNSDELKEQTLSRRYAGHQVQPKKTLALLKTRGWMVSGEDGLQKVYYKDNIIATVYAQADWFSPADIESPVIEFVRFEDRKTYKPVSLDKISKLIFSEVMRDMDLVVSVAHVGGVDPEASLSTIEIRTAIVEEILKLMKLSNVKLKGSHAYITGAHGEYTVHLGSGVVHKMGSGSINIVSVPSGHRGKIFLPFIDSDPRSVEVITKIVLFAEDTKIKDPSILEQIKN